MEVWRQQAIALKKIPVNIRRADTGPQPRAARGQNHGNVNSQLTPTGLLMEVLIRRLVAKWVQISATRVSVNLTYFVLIRTPDVPPKVLQYLPYPPDDLGDAGTHCAMNSSGSTGAESAITRIGSCMHNGSNQENHT
jgi:hypothetical protein